MRRAVGVLAAVALGLAAPGAWAAQMDPSTPPSVSGPLTESNDTYTGDSCRKQGFGGSATSKRCRFFYRFDPAAESDAAGDYGVWWFQARFAPKPGWCLVRAETTISMEPEDFQATAWSAKDRKVHRKKKTLTVRLEADAGGNTTTPGSVERSFIARKGRTVVRWDSDTRTMKLKWRGRATPHKVALAGGFEGAWDPTVGPPGFDVVAGPTYMRC